jgi:hypothetical protein
MEDVQVLFGKTRIDQIEELLGFLFQIQEIVELLLLNGQNSKIGDFHFSEEEYVVEDARELLARLRTPDPLEDA